MDDTTLMGVDDGLGNIRPLGLIPGDPRRMQAVPLMADTDLIPESEWVEFNDWPAEIKIKDQNGRGACNGHAAATAIEVARFVAGMPHVPVSAWYIYAILCQGRDNGSMILDALNLTKEDGAAPESLVKYGIINPGLLTPEAHAAASRYKIEIGSRLTTAAQIGSAVQRKQSINLAVAVTGSFNRLDSDGVPGLSRGACNHAVHVGLGMKKSKAGKWLVLCSNSWTTQWGDSGFCWFPVDFLPTANYFEAYAVRAVVDDTADITRPPEIIA